MNEKLLILRTAPWQQIDKLIEHCRKRWEYPQIHMLKQRTSLVPDDLKEDLIVHNAENGNISHKDLITVIKDIKGIDAVYLPYNDPRGHGYYKYDLMLFRSRLKNVFAFNIHEKEEKLNRLSLLFKRPIYQFFEYKPIKHIANTVIYPFLYVFLYLYILFKPRGKKKDTQVIFVTHFGKRLPSARVRSYNFSNMLNSMGLKTEVISTDDDFGISNEGTSPIERIMVNIQLASCLLQYPDAAFCVLKPDYHFLAPYLIHKIKGNKIIFDQDDWDFNLRVFGLLKEEHVVRKMLKTSSCNLVSSKALTDEVKNRGYAPDYVPTGVDSNLFKPKEIEQKKQNEIVCGWIGMIWGRKVLINLLFLLRCFKATNNPQLFFHLAAGGIHVENFRRKAEKELNNKIRLTKWIQPDKIPEFINSVDIGVMPFIGKYNYNKAKSPTKLFEFMACGKPCITTPIGEMKEIIQHGENGFLAETKEEFVKYIELLAGDADLRERIGRNARKTIEEKYSLEVCGKKLYEVLKKREII